MSDQPLPHGGVLQVTDQGPEGLEASLPAEGIRYVVLCVGREMLRIQMFPAVNVDDAEALIMTATCSKVYGGV